MPAKGQKSLTPKRQSEERNAVRRPKINQNTVILIDDKPVEHLRRTDALDSGLAENDYKYTWGNIQQPHIMTGLYEQGFRKVPFDEVKEDLTERELMIYQVKDNAIFYGDENVLMRTPLRHFLAIQGQRMAEHLDQLSSAPRELESFLDEIMHQSRGITKANAPRVYVDTDEWTGATQTIHVAEVAPTE